MDIESLTLHTYTVAAKVITPSDKDVEDIENVAKGFFVASQTPFEDGKPRMMFMQCWMAHEGRNLNGDAFVSEELRQRVKEGLFSPPYAGMIDMDHDFSARGFWYKTAYAFDEEANKWGILATGAVWSWKNPELAAFISAQMAANGFINVSMSAIPEAREITMSYSGFEGQLTSILHNPIFFTTSILSVPPGDPDAKGIASETTITSNEVGAVVEENSNIEDLSMNENEKAFEELKAANAKLHEEVEALKTKVAEAEVSIRSLSDVKAALEHEIETVKAELKVFTDKEVAAAAETKAEAEKKQFEARLAEVPEVVKQNLEKHAEKALVLAKWKDATDEDWKVIRSSFALAYVAPTYLNRSKEEGVLPVGTSKETNEKGLKDFLRD